MTTTITSVLTLLQAFCLSSVLFATAAFAQQQDPSGQLPKDSIFVIDDFSKLLYSHASPYSLVHGEATDAYNVRANKQYGSLAKRDTLNLVGTCSHSAAVTGLHRFYKADGTKQTLTSSSTFIDYISDAGTCTNLEALLTDGKRWQMMTYKDIAVATNGYDAPLKWDGLLTTTADTAGARTAGDLMAQLGSPFAKIAAGAGLTASRWYQYRMAFYDGTTYKYTTARSNPLLLGTVNKQIALTGIPLGPLGTTHRYLYRTVGDTTRANVLADNTFYLVTDISDNTTTTYTDSSADATIAADGPPTWATVSAGVNVTPPHGQYLFIFKDYLWLGNDPSGTTYGKSTVYFSGLTNPDYWVTGTNYFLIRPDDGDDIAFVLSYLGTLTIGKNNTISKIYTDTASSTGWTVSQPYSFIGAAAPYSAQITPLGIMYLGRYGLYRFDGQSSTLISDVVTKDINDINPANYTNTAGAYYGNEYRLAYASIGTGSAVNDRVLLYDLVRNSFVKDTENVNVWEFYDSADDFGALYSGSSTTDGRVDAQTVQPTNLIFRYLTDLTSGTFQGTYGNQTDATDPTTVILSLGSSAWSADSSAWNSESTSTWVIDQSPGYWLSPISQVNASSYSKLYWNQNLGSYGNVGVGIRSASTSAGIAAATWSSNFTNPSGSDLSAVTANNYVQLRVTMDTSNYGYTPYLFYEDGFITKLVYSQGGSAAETSVPSSWATGWLDLVPSAYQFYLSNYPKIIKEIDVYYEGSAGTANFNIQNLKGDSLANFSIDLSKNRLGTDNYWGTGSSKVFRWLPSLSNATSNKPPVGDKFMITITENGTTGWKIQRIAIRYDVNPYTPYKNQ